MKQKVDDAWRLAECLMCGRLSTCEREDSACEDETGRCKDFFLPPPTDDKFTYDSPNGYHGRVFHRQGTDVWTLSIFDKNWREVLHSYRGNAKSREQLKEQVDGFPDFLRTLDRLDAVDDDGEEDDGR